MMPIVDNLNIDWEAATTTAGIAEAWETIPANPFITPLYTPEDIGIDDGGIEEDFPEEPVSIELKKERLTARKAIEEVIFVWTFLADTGAYLDEVPPAYLDRYNFNYICDYTHNFIRNSSLHYTSGESTCHYCPYFALFKRECSGEGSNLQHWDRAKSREERKHFAKGYLDELLQLQKVIILNPKSVLPRYKGERDEG